MIVSSIPGRLRLRDRTLRDARRLETLRADLSAMDDVESVESNPRTGSLLVHYNAEGIAQGVFEARVRLAMGNPCVATKPAPKVGAGGTARVKANRWAKRGMLASLTVSLLLAVAGAKRWHAITGMLFLHALVVHLWVHRRHLFR